jgi:hypothetical protein
MRWMPTRLLALGTRYGDFSMTNEGATAMMAAEFICGPYRRLRRDNYGIIAALRWVYRHGSGHSPCKRRRMADKVAVVESSAWHGAWFARLGRRAEPAMASVVTNLT